MYAPRPRDSYLSREIVYHIDNLQARAHDKSHNIPGVARPHFHN
jgi:hypothetical protein